MGEPKLEFSTIKLHMDNQQKIIPFGWLPQVLVDIFGVKVCTYLKVIQIVDDEKPYPALLGLDWAIDRGGIISLKRRSMIFENDGMQVIVPLDPEKGEQYTEPIHEGDDVNHIYRLIA